MTLTFCEYKLFVRDLHNNIKLLPFLVFKSFIGIFLLFAVTMMANTTISFIEEICGFPTTSYENFVFLNCALKFVHWIFLNKLQWKTALATRILKLAQCLFFILQSSFLAYGDWPVGNYK